ncbi:c-type cytochrome [bacterium]|nr:c-type cytochrome [bacterium]
MNKALIACLILGMLMLSACPGGGGDSSDGGSSASGNSGGSSTAQTPPADDNGIGAGGGAEKSEAELVARGREIYYGTEYSNTGLTCAHCHAGSPDEEQGARLIAHTGYGAVPRGSWKHTSQAELDAKMGKAATILDAANFCVGAPYMAHKEMLIEGEDGAALTAFMVSIADPTAWDAQPFLLDLNRSMPVAGLTPNMENGERIYEHSCEKCHDAGIDGLEDLHGLGDWMNPMQLMAKIRKQKNWYDEYENASYAALPSHDLDRAVAWMLGIDTAWAQDENPCAENPCGGHDDHEEHEDGTFEENAMPHYASDILSDQDVVDVAHFIIENE